MHEAEARVIEVAREIVARYRQQLGPLGSQALVDAVDALPAVLTPPGPPWPGPDEARLPTGIKDLRDPKSIIPTVTVDDSRDIGDRPRTDRQGNPRDPRTPFELRDPINKSHTLDPRDPDLLSKVGTEGTPTTSMLAPDLADADRADFGTLHGGAPARESTARRVIRQADQGEAKHSLTPRPDVTEAQLATEAAAKVLANRAERDRRAEVIDPTNE